MRGEPTSSEDDLVGELTRKESRQANRPCIGNHTNLGLGEEERRLFGGDDEVGSHGDLESTSDGHAVHCGNDGLVAIGELWKAPEPADAVVGVEGLALVGGVEVPAGREELLASTGEDRDA